MGKIKKDLKNFIYSSINKNISKVIGKIYFYDGKFEMANPQSICILFENLDDPYHFFCGPDGSSIDWENQIPLPEDMKDYGEEIVRDLSNIGVFKNICNQKLIKTNLINSELDKVICGVNFIFKNKYEINIMNLGDELKLFNKIPEKIIYEEKIKLIPIVR